MNPDRLAELEEERRFLLRSLVDLQREHDVGDVDDEDFRTLCDGYTARAAVVLREIADGKAAIAERRPKSARRRLLSIAGVVVVAGLIGWLVARSSGQRLEGDSMTGGASPDRVAVLLSQARAQLGPDSNAASGLYLEVLKIDSDNAEARTYIGWLLALSVQGQAPEVAEPTLKLAKESLNRAIATDPTYPDPYCFLAVIAARFEADPVAAKVPAQQCLDNNPPADMRGFIDAFVGTLDTTPQNPTPAGTTPET